MNDAAGVLTGLSAEEKRALLASILRGRAQAPRMLPASYAQRTLWVLEQMAPGRATYNMHAAVRVEGPLDTALLTRAINEIVRRHESLRTTFKTVDGEPLLVISPELVLDVPRIDLRSLPPDPRNGQARRLATDEARQPFNLATGPLFRVKLLQLGDEEYVTLLTLHHINADGWSVQLFMRELVALYQAFSAGRPSPLLDPPIQYADYAAWQRRKLDEGGAAEALAYWRTRLAGIAPLDLPTDRPRTVVPSVRGSIRPFRFPAELAEAVRSLSRRAQCTPFMTLLSAFQVLLHRWTGQDDVPVGSPYANRSRPELEGLIGYFVNMLVLRNDLGGDPTFLDLLGRTRVTVLEAIRHQDLPFNKVVEELNVARDLSRNPLFQVMFAYQNTPRAEVNLSSLKLKMGRQPTDGGTGASKFELTLSMTDTRKALSGRFQYNTDLFDAATIDRLIEHFRVLLTAIAARPDARLSELPILTANEERALLASAGSVDTTAGECVHHRFEAHAARAPDAEAIIAGADRISYGALNRQANRIAHHLRDLGVGPEVVVAIAVADPIARMAAVLGVLKAGGAYLPIDASLPAARLTFVLEEAGFPCVITEDALRQMVPGRAGTIVCLDRDRAAIDARPDHDPEFGAGRANLAYVISTSGSLGVPKGVMVSHSALASVLDAWEDAYALRDRRTRHLQMASFAFDVFTGDWVRALGTGGTLICCPREILLDPRSLYTLMREQNIGVAEFVPAVIEPLMDFIEESGDSLAFMSLVAVGSDVWLASSHDRLRRLVGPATRVVSSYGLTEATIDSTYFEDALADGTGHRPVPIGRPLANTQVYVLDQYAQLAPVGVPGELHVGGAGLARGYHRRPGLTAEKFIPDPFSNVPGARLYRTGDRARWRADGNLELLGRIDHQVKVRGVRIELGEVEVALADHPSIREAAVVSFEAAPGDRRLAAYVVPDPTGPAPSAAELRAFLRKRLPEPMVPAAFVTLPGALPRSASGKVDRNALPLVREIDETASDFVAPRTETEQVLAVVWSELLGRERIDAETSFFDMGGHSLLAIRLAARVRDRFGVELPLPRIFLAPTISGLGAVIDELVQAPGETAPEAPGMDLEAEGSLDPKIRPEQLPTPFASEPSGVLLTGATGFLGAYLLRDLLRQTRAEIACLVRAEHAEDAASRIRETLLAYGLWDDAWRARIVPVPGDLARPRFGLSDLDFARLADRVEAIVHNGAVVNTIYPYAMLRDVNVLGTQDVLRLAAIGRTKTVHHVSTLSVLKSITRSDPVATLIREADPLGPGTALRGGYAQSKWAAERMMAAARTRGVPVCIYRPGRISGDSSTGVCNTNDLLFMMLKNVRQTGSVPVLKGRANLVPVDFVSRAIIHLAMRPESRDRTFHLLNPSPLPIPELIECVQSLGAPVRAVSVDEWQRDLRDVAAPSAALALRPPRARSSSRPGKLTIDCQNTREGLAGSGIECPPVDARLIATYYAYLAQNGLLDGQ